MASPLPHRLQPPGAASTLAERPPPSRVAPRPNSSAADRYQELKRTMRTLDLHTVCESARCPQHGRVLGARHRHLYDFGRYLHPRLRFCAVPSGKPATTAG